MKSWRIRHRLLFLALLPAALLSLALLVYSAVSGILALDEEMRVRGQTTVRGLAPASEYGVISGHQGSLQVLAREAQQQPDVRSIGIVDVDGRILAQVGTSLNDAWEQGGAGEVAEGKGWIGFYAAIKRTMVEFEDFPEVSRMAVAVNGDRQIGFVYVEFGDDNLVARKLALIRNSLLILFAGLGVAAMIALRMARRFSEPLQRLIAGVGVMGEGRLDARVAEDSVGELAVLERGFNEMARRLEDGQRTMQQQIDDATAQLALQAQSDSLTGLINRREFERRAEQALQSARTGGVQHALCYLDLDHFKIVNDSCGHHAGDELLRQLAHLLQRRLRDEDTLARLGGDEFGILLTDCPFEDALRVAESLRQLVEGYRFSWRDRVFAVGVSIGMVAVDADAKSLTDLLTLADQACYAAKEKGRNCVQICRCEARELIVRRNEMNWVARLTRALEEDRLFLVAQRIYPLVTGGDGCSDDCGEIHAELMPRLRDENGDTILPSVFLPAAERFALMPAVNRWLVAAACRAVARFGEVAGGRRLLATISLPGAGIDADMLLPWVKAQAEDYGIEPGCLCFEIGEASASIRLVETMRLVQGLRKLGCRFCLANFGSGFASFSYLRHLPPDFVKIDAAIVREVATDRVSQTVAQAILEMGQDLGFKVIAGEVDDGCAYSVLRDYGIDLGQGNWFESPTRYEAWLQHFAAERRDGSGGETAAIRRAASGAPAVDSLG